MKHLRLTLLFAFYVPFSLFGQVSGIVETDGIRTSLHQQHIGRIFFTDRAVTSSELDASHFLTHYTLTNKSDLSFVAYFDNSLTNYLHRLSPGLPADSLVKKGNYQFTLYIDGKEIYKSNLMPGAPMARMQHTATWLNRSLIANSEANGSWSESFWNRFLFNGGDAALTDGDHLLKMEIRPYLHTDPTAVGSIIASGELKMTVRRNQPIDISDIKLNAIEPYDSLPVSEEDFDRDRIRQLKGAVVEGVFKKISSVVVLRNGRLLIEEYFNGAGRHTLHDTRSVGKSFASTLMGIAIGDGYIKNEQQTLSDFYDLESYAGHSLQKGETSIYDLLTMSSGFDGNDDDPSSPGNEENMYPTTDWVRFALEVPYKDMLKGQWHYFTAGCILLGDILDRTVPGGLGEYAGEKLFRALQIKNYKWQYTPQQVPNTAGGLQLCALDFAKYGQLYANNGKWGGKQIIPGHWVSQTMTRQKPLTGRENEYYGYLFWNKTFTIKGIPYETYYCAGNGGNYILIFNEANLVIVITATAYGQTYAHPQVSRMLTEYILPALLR